MATIKPSLTDAFNNRLVPKTAAQTVNPEDVPQNQLPPPLPEMDPSMLLPPADATQSDLGGVAGALRDLFASKKDSNEVPLPEEPSKIGSFLKDIGGALAGGLKENFAQAKVGPGADILSKMLFGKAGEIYPSQPEQMDIAMRNAVMADKDPKMIEALTGAKTTSLKSADEWLNVPTDIQKTTGGLVRGIKGLDSSSKDIDVAIKNKDLGAFTTAINNALAANSVMNEQGVITDPEAARVLATVQTQIQGLNVAGMDKAQITRMFDSPAWKNARNIIAVMKNSAKEKLRGNIQLAPQIQKIVDRTGIDLTPSADENRGQKSEDVITKQLRDAMAVIEAKTAGQQVGEETFNKALGLVKAALLEGSKLLNPPAEEKSGEKPKEQPKSSKKYEMVKDPSTGKWTKKEKK